MSTKKRHRAFVATACLVLAGFAGGVGAGGAAAETPLERGRVLMNGIVACGNCHTPQGPGGPVAGMELAGGGPVETEVFTAYAPNLTPDPDTGLGRWSDAEIIAAIREGRRPDGSLIGPPMPIHYYRGISDEDAAALVAYLRALAPVRNAVPKSEYRMPLPASWGPPVGSVPPVPRTDPVAYGAYMAGPLGHCLECHTPMKPGGVPDTDRIGAGGMAFPGPWGVSVAANITPHPKHGIGAWTDRQIKDAITGGVRPDGRRLHPPMAYAWYATIPEPDLDALVAYLRTLKPLE
ncbi:c-type cytochrome [Azospirillum halopraeferens]|uniref:c-type cytochrome n=1 Tax=Azospirillum halopraeferens TaxID=34010 RepID=UPI000A038630|nr:cytochrome c [Azospirillum halopraeferens]